MQTIQRRTLLIDGLDCTIIGKECWGNIKKRWIIGNVVKWNIENEIRIEIEEWGTK